MITKRLDLKQQSKLGILHVLCTANFRIVKKNCSKAHHAVSSQWKIMLYMFSHIKTGHILPKHFIPNLP